VRVPISWLKEYVDVEVEPARLAEALTLAGLEVGSVESDGADRILDIDVTTNRVDCMNVHGVAREVSVLYGKPLRPLELSFDEGGPPAADALSVSVAAPDLCPRFCARVMDVRLGPSPAWLRDRLAAVGVRSISNVVDLSNYVMMEMGHPSHAFDLARIPEARLVIRWARDGESLRTLDDEDRLLSLRIGVVAGPDSPLALAGIMGGASSEVSETTEQIALEAAYWEPVAIRRAAKALGMHTEASHRFERGADPEGPVVSTARFAHLLRKLGAGRVRPGLIDVQPAPRPRRTAVLRPARMSVLLGAEVDVTRAHVILKGLGFEAQGAEGEGVRFAVPSWRGDVAREADLVEEVARHHGLHKISSRLPPSRGLGGLSASQRRERRVREALLGAGLTEVVSYTLVAPDPAVSSDGQVLLENPLSQELGALRSSLVLPGLLDCLKGNLRQGRRQARLFEIGRVFSPGDPLPVEEKRLAFVLFGALRPSHWSEPDRLPDVFDGLGIVDGVGNLLGVRPERSSQGIPAFLHPGKSATLRLAGQPVGYVGALHPEAGAARELPGEPVIGELSLKALLEHAEGPIRFRPFSRQPAVSRDLSLLCEARLTAERIEAAILSSAGPELRSVTFIDRFEGPPLPEGKLSLSVALRFQAGDRTLTGDEVSQAIENVARALKRVGAEIRGG
jgi:phenylalanyl-tRNA synthetase beta chain